MSERVHIRVRHTSNVFVGLFSHSCTNYVCVLIREELLSSFHCTACVKEVSLFKLNGAVKLLHVTAL